MGQAHKTRFWYRLGVFSKFSDEHPRHLYRGVPPGVNPPPPPFITTATQIFQGYPFLESVTAKSVFFFSLLDKNLHYSKKKRIFTLHHSD